MHYIATEFQFPPIKIRENSMDKLLKWTTRASFLLTTVGTIGYACTFTVNGGERAILWDMGSGIKKEVYGEGINLMIPFYQKPIIFDIRTRPTLISTKTGSKDLQNVNIQLRVLFRPVEKFLPKIYTPVVHCGLPELGSCSRFPMLGILRMEDSDSLSLPCL
jgi:hypothetical protein